MVFQLEEERDRLVETVQQHKKKYNKLHDAYLEKVKRCRALEEMFKRQKTLTGLVMKSALDQRHAGESREEGSLAREALKGLSYLYRATLDVGEASVCPK